MGPSINGVHKEGERVCLNAKYKLREHYCEKVRSKIPIILHTLRHHMCMPLSMLWQRRNVCYVEDDDVGSQGKGKVVT